MHRVYQIPNGENADVSCFDKLRRVVARRVMRGKVFASEPYANLRN